MKRVPPSGRKDTFSAIKETYIALFSITLAGLPALAADRGILEVDPQNGAATLRLPLGPGIGRPGLRFVPSLIGKFAPLVELPPPVPGLESVDQMPALLATTGFELSPGTLEVWMGSEEGSASLPGAQWIFPDGSGGGTRDGIATGMTARALWATFGYGSGDGQASLPVSAPEGAPVPSVLAGTGGDVLVALPEPPGLAALPEQDPDGEGNWDLGRFPSRMLVVHGERGFEYQRKEGKDPHSGVAPSAQYRLAAMRSDSGEAVTFTYGPNGLDFEAAWGAERVQVTLAGTTATTPIPAPASLELGARLQVTYIGEVKPEYAITALKRPKKMAIEGTVTDECPGSALGRRPGDPGAFFHSMQVSRVEEVGGDQRIEFSYGKVPAEQPAGRGFAPTVLREIILPGRTLRLDWEGKSLQRQAEVARGGSPGDTWLYGVSALHDRDLNADGPASTYLRVPPPGLEPGDAARTWIRQSRHFALGYCCETGASCQTHIRDRWDLRWGTPAGSVGSSQDLERRLAYEYESDIPTWELDLKAGILVPVPGQLTRWLNWVADTGLEQPPDLHGGKPPVQVGWVGLKGGNPGEKKPESKEPKAKSPEQIWFHRPTVDPRTGEVTLGVTVGPKPTHSKRPGAGATGPTGSSGATLETSGSATGLPMEEERIYTDDEWKAVQRRRADGPTGLASGHPRPPAAPGPMSTSNEIIRQCLAKNRQAMEETSRKAMEMAMQRNQQAALAASQAAQAQQAALEARRQAAHQQAAAAQQSRMQQQAASTYYFLNQAHQIEQEAKAKEERERALKAKEAALRQEALYAAAMKEAEDKRIREHAEVMERSRPERERVTKQGEALARSMEHARWLGTSEGVAEDARMVQDMLRSRPPMTPAMRRKERINCMVRRLGYDGCESRLSRMKSDLEQSLANWQLPQYLFRRQRLEQELVEIAAQLEQLRIQKQRALKVPSRKPVTKSRSRILTGTPPTFLAFSPRAHLMEPEWPPAPIEEPHDPPLPPPPPEPEGVESAPSEVRRVTLESKPVNLYSQDSGQSALKGGTATPGVSSEDRAAEVPRFSIFPFYPDPLGTMAALAGGTTPIGLGSVPGDPLQDVASWLAGKWRAGVTDPGERLRNQMLGIGWVEDRYVPDELLKLAGTDRPRAEKLAKIFLREMDLARTPLLGCGGLRPVSVPAPSFTFLNPGGPPVSGGATSRTVVLPQSGSATIPIPTGPMMMTAPGGDPKPENKQTGSKGDSDKPATKPGIDPTKPAQDVLPGGLKRQFPAQHLGKSLNEIKEALKTATGKDRLSLQTAKKLLEQAPRLIEKTGGKN